MASISRQLLADHVYQYLVGQLTAHSLPIGSHVNALVIAEELSISRTTVNKAVARLIEDGFVRPDSRSRPVVVGYPSPRPVPEVVNFSFANQTEQTYEALLEGILRGNYHPGEILKERRLARELGVNPVTVHRAAERLNRDGLLERRRRRGWQVVKLRVGDLREIYRIRLMLEPLGVPKATARISDATLDELEQEADRLIALGERSSVYERRQADYHLHRSLYEASGNRILGETLDPLIRKALLMTTVGFRYGRISRSFEEHKEILRALRRREPAEVTRWLKAHLKAAMTFNITAWKDGADSPPAEGG
ncbi:MAG TPA: GntR family transcriptional regulator [Isosphaeraceae bacterium]|nr:GntR family transcriptional regulator [Isosphaeraceae bacterium]